MTIPARNFKAKPSADGSVDLHFPLGNKGIAYVFDWDETALDAFRALVNQRTTGTAALLGLTGYVTGADAAGATYSIAYVSGASIAGIWAVSSTSATSPGSIASTGGFFKLGITVNGVTKYSQPIHWSWVSATPTDILAPTIPLGLAGVAGSGYIDWSWYPSVDVNDGTTNGSGVKDYTFHTADGDVSITGVAGIVTAPTLTNVGAISNPAAPSFSQSGRNFTITSAGTGIDGTSDQIGFLNWQVSGNCRISGKVHPATGSANAFAPHGLIIREDLTGGSKYVAWYLFFSSDSNGPQGKQRVVTGGARSNLSSQTGIGAAQYMMIERIGDVFTLYLSVDGLAWAQSAQTTISMNATVYIGGFATSMIAGSQSSVLIDDLAPSTSPLLTYRQSTTTAKSATIKARDVSLNVGTASAATASVTPLAVAAGLIKWHPGWYVVYSTIDTFSKTRADQVATTTAKGYVYWCTWKSIETSRGVYNFNAIDAAFNYCKSIGLRFILQVQDRTFSGSSSRCPAYLDTEIASGGMYYKANSKGSLPKLWDPAVMTRWLLLVKALSDHLDGDAMFEGFRGEETDIGFSTGEFTAAGFASQNYLSQLLNQNKALSDGLPGFNNGVALFQTSMKWIGANFLPTQSDMVTFCNDLYSRTKYGLGAMSSDLIPGKRTGWSYEIYIGNIWNGAWVSGGTNWSAIGAIFECQIQDPEEGGKAGSFTPAQFYGEAQYLGSHHMPVWDKNYAWTTYGYAANAQAYWDSTQASDTWRWIAYLATTHALNTTVPAPLSGRVTTA